ncbi:MAG: hypothetical protein ACLSHG_02815 [Oscillospiraceae bacterium]
MKKRLLVLLTVLLVLAACTPGAFAYDVAAEQAADFGTASLESALPEQAYDAFGELSVVGCRAAAVPCSQSSGPMCCTRAAGPSRRRRAMRRCCWRSCFCRRCARPFP